MYKLLDHIHYPEDLKKLKVEELPMLAAEARDFILDIVSAKSGHLGASLGVMELTIALHYYFDTPHDVLIWDVGHQAYGHKLFTGRQADFDTLRQWKGMSGFPTREESAFDTFGVGHSSTSISAITGMALANKLQNIDKKHVAVIGDASIVSGMAFEGLNHLGDTHLDVLVILNDNNIGIDPSVGALQKHFNNIDDSNEIDFFEALGFHYHGIVDGHDFNEIFQAFDDLKDIKTPKLLHVRTTKGKGYPQAEKDQVLWHAPGKFDKKTGEIVPKEDVVTFQKVVGETLDTLFRQNKNLVAITPAMPTGSGLVQLMQNFPERVWDVGIAEQHAVTLSAGLATQGMVPFCVIYSTFLQRAYDQLIHDVALQNLPVVFLIDRAGIVGNDGATHHGYFDIAFLSAIPNMIVACPADDVELEELCEMASTTEKPFAIRYPRGEVKQINLTKIPTKFGKGKCLKSGEKVALLCTGHISGEVAQAAKETQAAVYHFPFVKPLDKNVLQDIFEKFDTLLTYEHGVEKGGFGTEVLKLAVEHQYKGNIEIHGYPDAFIEHASMEELHQYLRLDAESIKQSFQKCFI